MSHFSVACRANFPYAVPSLMQYHLFRVVLDVITLELDKLIEPKLAQCLSFSRIFPADPRKILRALARHSGGNE